MPFEIPTTDGMTVLRGQIDFPAATTADAKLAAVVFIAGTGLFDRHMLIGRSNTTRDFAFDDLSAAMTAKGLAVIRYDYRGVACNERDPRITAETVPAMRIQRLAELCIDKTIRSRVTPETNLDDLTAVIAHVRAHRRIDGRRLGALGISEGGIYIGRALAKTPELLKAVFLVGPPLESPASLMQWQMIGRFPETLLSMAANPGTVTADEIRAKLPDSRLENANLQALLPTGADAWTFEQLAEQRLKGEDSFAKIRDDALASSDAGPYPSASPIVMASQRWWKMFFNDTTPAIDAYAPFKGPIHLFIGTKDSQVAIDRQRAALARSPLAGSTNIRWHVYDGKGHLLGDNALFGPMSASIRDDIAGVAAAKLINSVP